MKKIISIFLTLLFTFSIMPSCSEQKYEIEYPEIYTPEYCSENYVDADPNLIHIHSAENSIGSIDIPGGYATFYGIKDVPLDEYLCVWESIMFAPFRNKIVKNKELHDQEILSYEIKSVELFWQKLDVSYNMRKYWTRLGEHRMYESIASLNRDRCVLFQSHLNECIDTSNYKCTEPGISYDSITGKDGYDEFSTVLKLRVSFVEYENIVWDSVIVYRDNDYYFYCYVFIEEGSEGYWDNIYIPLNSEIKEILLSQPFMNEKE